jgi:acyl carrier protein
VSGAPPTEAEIERDVIATIARIAKVPPERLTPDADFRKHLRLDSLTGLKVLAALEKRFGVSVPDLEIDRVRTVAQAVELVRKLVKA